MNEGKIFIRVTKLSKSYGDKRALDDISFTVARGNITGFIGPNGAGKTTTIKCLLGLIRKNSGDIEVNGIKVDNPQKLKFRIRVGALLEFHSFYPHLTAAENLSLLAQCDQIDVDDAEIDRLLNLIDLRNSKGVKVKAFSSGMRQKLAVASAFLNNPELMILDEPFNGLDPNAMDNLSKILKNHALNGGSVLVSSHLLGEVEDLCDDIIIIHQGKIVRQGDVKELTVDKSLKHIYLEATGAENV